ncbi:hypothetical protein L345_13194 [Ophiophagus hannah]|uniref:Uncharacterized protein n=1 Tax=Ophiophagus hannah TaxID=8665 RepID=V8NHF8_OPHHA|nr:hypothetical protein L345_13194 [Ophiophagus hannah]
MAGLSPTDPAALGGGACTAGGPVGKWSAQISGPSRSPGGAFRRPACSGSAPGSWRRVGQLHLPEKLQSNLVSEERVASYPDREDFWWAPCSCTINSNGAGERMFVALGTSAQWASTEELQKVLLGGRGSASGENLRVYRIQARSGLKRCPQQGIYS